MKIGTQIKKITRVDTQNYQVWLEYIDGFKGKIDLSFIFENPKKQPLVLEILRGTLFGRCFIESGALAWPNGYELCPDAIRQWMLEQTKHKKAA